MKISLKNIKGSLANTVKKSPVEIITGIIYFLRFTYLDIYCPEKQALIVFFVTVMFFINGLNKLCQNKWRPVYYASVIVPILAMYVVEKVDLYNIETSPVVIIFICAVIFMIASKRDSNTNEGFVINSVDVTKNVFLALFFGILCFLICFSIIFSAEFIFDINDLTHLNFAVLLYFIFIFTPVLFLFLQDAELKKDFTESYFYNILINYILSPSVVIYGVIMYLYFAKIVLQMSLPDGIIATTAVIFMIVGIIVRACRLTIEKPIMQWFFKYFHFISIPAIIMLWMSAYERILRYGMTNDRVYLILLIAILTFFCMAMISTKLYKLRYLAAMTVVLFLGSTFLPVIRQIDNSDTATISEPGIRFIQRHFTEIDICGMSTFINETTAEIRDNKIHVYLTYSGDQKVVAVIPTQDFIDNMLARYKVNRQMPFDVIREQLEYRSDFIYRNDTIIIAPSRIFITDSLTLDSIQIDFIFKK